MYFEWRFGYTDEILIGSVVLLVVPAATAIRELMDPNFFGYIPEVVVLMILIFADFSCEHVLFATCDTLI